MPNSHYPGDPDWIENLRKMHPFKLAMYVAIIGICIMFIFLVFGYFITKSTNVSLVNIWFSTSTFIVLLTSFTTYKLKIYYLSDKINLLLNYYYLTFILVFLFGVSQFLGWYLMQKQGISFARGTISHTYFNLLTWLHLLHFVGGMVYLGFLIFKTLRVKKDIVKHLIFATDPYEFMLIDVASLYLHFMAILWVMLYIIFSIS